MKIHHPLLIFLFYIFEFLGKLIPLKLVPFFGSLLGKFAHFLLKKQRKTIIENLKIAFPEWRDEKIKRCVVENFKHYGITFFELFKVKNLKEGVEIEGIENLEGKPGILITGHIGNWELMAQVLGSKGIPLFALAKRSYLNVFTQFLIKLRKKGNVETILRAEEESSKLLLKAIKEKKIIGFLIDQDTKTDSLYINFFSKPASTPKGPVELALRKNLPLTFGYLVRKRYLKYFLKIEKIDTSSLNLEEILTLLNRKIEEVIRKHPTQWVWVHKRWRRQPTS